MNSNTILRQKLTEAETALAEAERAVNDLRALIITCNSMYHNENMEEWGCCYTCGDGVR